MAGSQTGRCYARMKSVFVCCTAAVLGALLAGCATGPSQPGPGGVTGVQGSDANPPLTIGMASTEVRRLWGEPAEVTPVADPRMSVEIWIYRGGVTTHVAPVATGVREVMAFNPVFEGGVVATAEPFYQVQTRRIAHFHHVVMIDGKVAESWQSRRELPVVMN